MRQHGRSDAASLGGHVLETGCRCGDFAEYAAKERGLRVTGLTISQAQYDGAVDRIAKAGLWHRVDFRLQGFRVDHGLFGGMTRVAMVEAVGDRDWPGCFYTLRDNRRPGRQATLRVIAILDTRRPMCRNGVDSIHKNILSGGMLPCPASLKIEIARAGRHLKGSMAYGINDTPALRRWHDAFNANWPAVAPYGR